MTGLQARPGGTLVERAIGYLGSGPADSSAIARDVLGLGVVPAAVADRVAVALLGSHPRVRRLPAGHWDLVRHQGGSPALDDVSFAVVDVETTGTRPRRGDRVVEIAIVSVADGTAEPVFESLLNPERPIPPLTRSLTRITDAMVRDRPVFGEIADEVVAALAGRVFVAHNVRFDWAFVT
ncbi:MAG: PolC-type DNA polymerase III, partial [Gemmatimonadales bacterium]